MLNLPKQYYVIILLVGVLLAGGGVTLWRQYQQPPVVEALEPSGKKRRASGPEGSRPCGGAVKGAVSTAS